MDPKHDQDKEITITELAHEMRRGFQQMQDQFTGLQSDFTGLRGEFTGLKDQFTGLETYMRHGFQVMSEKVDIVDGRLEHVERDVKEVRNDIEELKTGMFTPMEKESILGTIRHIDRRLEDEVHGKSIPLTRPEYDVLMDTVHLPNRFLKSAAVEMK